MNMRELYKHAKQTVPKTMLERYALNSIVGLFPDEPTSGAYAGYEERGYNSAYEMMVPDADFEDEEEYRDWLKTKTTDTVFIERCSRRWLAVEQVAQYDIF